MAGKSLGTLTLDLVAKIGGFTGPLDKAGREANKRLSGIKKDAAAVGTAVASMSVATAGALAALTVSTVQSAGEISRLAQMSGTGVEEFQRYAAGAKAVGMEQGKLSDVFKDTQDKIGDFIATGGGELKNFFDYIAPQVGVTAEQFRNLSGPDALQLYVSSLEKAGVSQNEMVFYMEAISDESSLLLPLLKNNAAGFTAFGEEASKAGAILSQDTIRTAQELNAVMFLADQSVDGLKNQISAALLPVLSDFAVSLLDVSADGTVAASAADTLASALKGVVATAVGTYAATQLAGKGLGGLAFIISSIPDGWNAVKNAASSVGDDLDATAQRYATALDKIWEAGDRKPGEGTANARVKRLADFMSQAQAAAGAASKAITASQKAATDSANKAAAAAAKAIQGQVDALQLQAKTLGMTTEAVTLYKLEQDGATKAQLAQASAALEAVAAYEKQQKVLEERAALVERVSKVDEASWSEASRSLYAYQQQVETLQAGVAAGILSEEQRDQIIAGIEDQTAAAEKSAGQMTVFMDEAARNIQDAFANFLFDPFSKGLDGMLVGFLKTIQRMAAEAAASQLANQLFGAVGSGGARSGGLLKAGISAISGWFANADGNAFSAGNVIPFAKGGSFTNSIVNTPTLFPFANGTGLMGEAGPEAIMPLSRGPDGSLGVRSLGGSGSASININAPVTVQAQAGMSSQDAARQGNQIGQAMTAEVRRQIVNELRQGGIIWRAMNGKI